MRAYAPGWIATAAAALLLLTACGGGGSTSPEPSTSYEGPLAAYAVVKLDPEPSAGLYLTAVDPLTAESDGEREPIELGHHGEWALSPDGSTMALGWAPTGNSGVGPERLFLVDLARWTRRDLDFEDQIERIFWSPDGARLYVVTRQYYASRGELATIDPNSGDIIARVDLPYSAVGAALSPDGGTLYLFVGEGVGTQSEPDRPLARLVAFDIEQGEVSAALELPDVRFGSHRKSDGNEEEPVSYQPGAVMSPDGSTYYVVHAGEDRVTVVDLGTMTVRGTGEIHRPSSIVDRLLGLFAGTARAVGPITAKRVTISPDGRLLYVTGWEEGPTEENDEGWEFVSDGLKVVDAESFEILAEDTSPAIEPGIWRHERTVPGPSGERLYAFRGLMLRVLEPKTLEVVTETSTPFYRLVVGPAPSAPSSARQPNPARTPAHDGGVSALRNNPAVGAKRVV